MATKGKFTNKSLVRVSKDDRIVLLEGQRRLLQIKEQVIALNEEFGKVNQNVLDSITSIAKRERIDPNEFTFDLSALEFRRK